jgi:insertion element IS1 protein InsB
MVARFAALPEHMHVPSVAASREVLVGCLEVEADDLWSFGQKKTNPHRIWIVMAKRTRRILAFHVGKRTQDSATHLWAKIPVVSPKRAIFHTDQSAAYTSVIPAARHRAIT